MFAPVSLAAKRTAVRFVLITVACICLGSVKVFSQSPKPTPLPGTKGASVKLAPKLDPRLQHVLQIMLSENRLRSIVQLDREAALFHSKYSRRILASVRSSKGASGLPSAQELRDLGKKAGAAERRLLLALKEERRHLDREINAQGPISLVRPLKVAAIEVARVVRMRTGSLRTEIPKLGQTAICRGDLVMDRLIYRYARAATAEDDYEVTDALRELQIQLACLSTRQIRIFESALVDAVNRAETTLPAARDPKRLLAIRDAFRQLFAPVIFATADASRLFPKYERPAIEWLLKHQNMLTDAALRKKTITYRVGLLFANRFSGKLTRARGDCGAAAKKIFDDGRGGRTCNALGALYQSVGLDCDVTQWVPTGPGAKKFSCELGCSGLPGKLSGGRDAAAGLVSLSKVCLVRSPAHKSAAVQLA